MLLQFYLRQVGQGSGGLPTICGLDAGPESWALSQGRIIALARTTWLSFRFERRIQTSSQRAVVRISIDLHKITLVKEVWGLRSFVKSLWLEPSKFDLLDKCRSLARRGVLGELSERRSRRSERRRSSPRPHFPHRDFYNNAGTAKIPASRSRRRILWIGLWVGNVHELRVSPTFPIASLTRS
jgi:hypothetical protein